MESLTKKLRDAIDTLSAEIAADFHDICRARADKDPEKIGIHAGAIEQNAIRLEVMEQVLTWATEAEPGGVEALAMAAGQVA